jgi:glycine betaine/proline transport system substrate-binding protein
MKKIKTLFILMILIMSALLVACGGDDEGNNGTETEGNDTEDKGVITIGKAPYDYEDPFVEITTIIAEEHGYEVEVMEGDVGFMFLSLAENDIDIWSGIWPSMHSEYLERFDGQFELGSVIFDDAPTGWAVPSYVEIDTIGELVGNEDIVNGELTGFEPGSGMMLTSEEVIEAHGLDLELVSGTMASMLTEVEYAISQEEPIVFLGWRPHTMFSAFDIKMLEDDEGIWGDDSDQWGIAHGFNDTAPEVYNFVKNMKMSLDDVEEYLYQHQEEDQDPAELAEQWIEDNRSDIDAWLEGN